MTDRVRTWVHRVLRKTGFDVVSLANIERFLEERDAERKRHEAARIAALRSRVGATPVPGGVLSAGSPEELMVMAASMFLPARVVLDLGCGIRPQPFVEAAIHICCEPCDAYLDRLIVERGGDGRYVFVRGTASDAIRLFPERSVDSVFLIDVVEHIDRDEAVRCLEGVRRIARSQVAVFTPIGFLAQEPKTDGVDQWGMSGVNWQRHRSGWTPSDFSCRDGWTVLVCSSFFTNDAYGRQLSPPVGAMWAILSVEQD